MTGCTTLAEAPRGCGSPPNDQTCLGKVVVPEKQVDVFAVAARQAIDAVNSPRFQADVAEFKRLHGEHGRHAAAWSGVEPDRVIGDMKRGIQGLEVVTYGNVRGYFPNLLFGNLAYDGAADGPIRLNRWGLPRPSESIANTIVHETAHRAGMRHPHSSSELDVARCEPPYVLGSLAEKQIVGPGWKAGPDDCALLSERS